MRAFLLYAALLLAARAAEPDASGCPPGYFFWSAGGASHCQICQPGCACAGGWLLCAGCSGGAFSPAAGAVSCLACPPGTTSDALLNAGCDPQNIQTPCANSNGPLGQVACRPAPPPAEVTFVAPIGALYAPPQYLPGGPPYVPVKIPPYYGDDGQPMLRQSY